MREIKLSKGLYTKVDDEDYGFLNRFKWFASKGRNTFYAKKNILIDGGKRSTISMHRVILLLHDKKLTIDHRSGDGLDNQKSNLRICTSQQNIMAQRKIKTYAGRVCSSKFKGVYFHQASKKYMAQIGINGKRKYLGTFDYESTAALVYNIYAKDLYGEFANLNRVN